MDRISGSRVFARDPDTIVRTTRHKVDDAFAVEMTLRNHPPQEPLVVRRSTRSRSSASSCSSEKPKQTQGGIYKKE
jgi:hypothetical protein